MPSKRMFGASTSTTGPILILFMMISGGCSLKCQQSEYELGERCCRLCPAGKFVIRDCTQCVSTICTPCAEGTYMNQPTGAIVCPDCTNCDADSGLKTKTLCTRTSDTVCEPLEGFHCVDSTDGGCRAAETHSSCGPGQFISRKGTALSDTVCSNCTEGTFSNGTLTSCHLHTKCEAMKVIKPGSVSADAECGENNSKCTIASVALCVSFLIVSIIIVSAPRCCIKRKESDHRETGTELRTISNGAQLSSSVQVHTGDGDSHQNSEHEETNGLVNGLVSGLVNGTV
ncbi:tumor necrosis factor receptor superfamily member 5 isoform X2 [Larimichthys crocea]|uniref:tumor necrosis factor receptor superfamily member 5 isoform X2 n=1 Tax=Larimichthys crocea TaxID=215358 RepID=UPI000F601409|nr:tumor necrosis factor receptor superfamily member 5 isoform X2 [Larimichthys crocea]